MNYSHNTVVAKNQELQLITLFICNNWVSENASVHLHNVHNYRENSVQYPNAHVRVHI